MVIIFSFCFLERKKQFKCAVGKLLLKQLFLGVEPHSLQSVLGCI